MKSFSERHDVKWQRPTECCEEHSRQVFMTCLRCVCAFPFNSCPVWTRQFFKRSTVSVTDSVGEIVVELSFHEALWYRGEISGIWLSHQRTTQANVAEYKHNMTTRFNDFSWLFLPFILWIHLILYLLPSSILFMSASDVHTSTLPFKSDEVSTMNSVHVSLFPVFLLTHKV